MQLQNFNLTLTPITILRVDKHRYVYRLTRTGNTNYYKNAFSQLLTNTGRWPRWSSSINDGAFVGETQITVNGRARTFVTSREMH